MKRWAPFIVSVVALAAMCVFIFAMSAEPADDSAELSMGIVWHLIALLIPGYDQLSAVEQLAVQGTYDHLVRKTAHFLEYAALGGLVLNVQWQGLRAVGAIPHERKGLAPLQVHLLVTSWVLATLYAASDEIHQTFVAGRAGMVTDVMLDSTGVLAGIALTALILHAVDRRRTPMREPRSG